MEIILDSNKIKRQSNNTIMVCPRCKTKMSVSGKELLELYKYGYRPIYCSRRCENDF